MPREERQFAPSHGGGGEAHGVLRPEVLLPWRGLQDAWVQASCHSALRTWSPMVGEGLVPGTTLREVKAMFQNKEQN